MGASTIVYLPANVQARNIIRVLGALCGEDVVLENNPLYARVRNCEIQRAADYDCVMLKFGSRRAFMMLELSSNGFRHLSFYSDSEENRTLARELVDFFGGFADYNDCDDIAADYMEPSKGWEQNSPDDGEPWDNLQQRIKNIIPVIRSRDV